MVDPRAGFAALDPCVHCGFCLPACPTYLATGDENDSPRGRIVFMRALAERELSPRDPSLRHHLDACLGCRGCEPACPSGVGYGRALEAARHQLRTANGAAPGARLALLAFRSRTAWRAGFGLARGLRDSGLAARLAGGSRLGFLMGMVAATGRRSDRTPPGAAQRSPQARTAQLFRGCVMEGLFPHVHDATHRTLLANGIALQVAPGQGCCGALHAHAGDLPGARALAERNVAAFEATGGPIVVNSAGCGAMLKDYGHLLGSERAARFAERVRDVAQVLAEAGPRRGAALPLRVAYAPPCHLQHAQGVHQEVLALFSAIPEMEALTLPGSDQCCGGAGLYTVMQPRLAREVLRAKVATLQDASPGLDLVATGNPGCIMQIGAGLRAEGFRVGVVHPVELLDRSYHDAGFYEAAG